MKGPPNRPMQTLMRLPSLALVRNCATSPKGDFNVKSMPKGLETLVEIEEKLPNMFQSILSRTRGESIIRSAW